MASDSDEVCISKISSKHMEYLRSRLIHYLSTAGELSAEILHIPGKPAQMTLSFGSQQGNHDTPSKTNKISVKNLPSSSDKEHLQMFFEYEKGQGGGPVKHVTLGKENTYAIIEFESAEAVDVVLKKRPIRMLGVTVEVEAYKPYLEQNETLKSIDLRGFPRELVQEISDVTLRDLRESSEAIDEMDDEISRSFTAIACTDSTSKPGGLFNQANNNFVASIARECSVIQESGIVLYDTSSSDIPVAQLIASRPLSKENNTFSIKILKRGELGAIGLGLVPRNYEAGCQPGWMPNSIGYHADDGGIFLGEGDPSKETIQASEGDVMSLYADMERKKVIFRKNGEQCIALSFDASDHLPCIGMHSVGEAVQIMDRNIWTQSSTSDKCLAPPFMTTEKYEHLWISPKNQVTLKRMRGVYSGWLSLFNPSDKTVAFQVVYGEKTSAPNIYGKLGNKCAWLDLVKSNTTIKVMWTIVEGNLPDTQKTLSKLFKTLSRRSENFSSYELAVILK